MKHPADGAGIIPPRAIRDASFIWSGERHLERNKKVQKARNLQRMMDEREKDALNRMIYNRHR